jgi:hypothetical protein
MSLSEGYEAEMMESAQIDCLDCERGPTIRRQREEDRLGELLFQAALIGSVVQHIRPEFKEAMRKK